MYFKQCLEFLLRIIYTCFHTTSPPPNYFSLKYWKFLNSLNPSRFSLIFLVLSVFLSHPSPSNLLVSIHPTKTSYLLIPIRPFFTHLPVPTFSFLFALSSHPLRPTFSPSPSYLLTPIRPTFSPLSVLPSYPSPFIPSNPSLYLTPLYILPHPLSPWTHFYHIYPTLHKPWGIPHLLPPLFPPCLQPTYPLYILLSPYYQDHLNTLVPCSIRKLTAKLGRSDLRELDN